MYFFSSFFQLPLQSVGKNNLFSIAQKELPPVALSGKKTILFFTSGFSLEPGLGILLIKDRLF
jgi:hypothetical protein